MTEREQEELQARAAKRTEWAAKALTAAGNDLDAAGARGAGVLADAADWVEGLAGEVRKLSGNGRVRDAL